MDGQYQNQISDLPKLNLYNLENTFKVYLDEDTGSYYYNLANTLIFPDELDSNFYTEYNVPGPNMPWTQISYNQYGTIKLWWLICIINKVDNPMIFPETGSSLKIPTMDAVRDILNQIQQNK